jgi:hypothetical protein
MRKQPVERQLIIEHPTNPPEPDSQPAPSEASLNRRPVRGRLIIAAAAAGWAAASLIPSAIGATAVGFPAISAAFAAAGFAVRGPGTPSLISAIERRQPHAC